MTLPASGNLSFSQILAEFGAPVGTKLSQLYRGGAYVPDIAQNAGVPMSGAIAVRDFLGASNVAPVELSDFTVSAFSSDGSATSATAETRADGYMYRRGVLGGYLQQYQWNTGGVDPSDYELRATHMSGTQPTGVFDTWRSMNQINSYTQNSGVLNVTVSGVIKLEIRPAGGGAVIDSCLITLNAEKTNAA